MIKRKDYEKPRMQVFELKRQPQLLVMSGEVDATMNGTFVEEEA